jgi:hypothetical protein
MVNRKLIATEAIAKALRARKRIGALPYESVSALDAAEKLGLEVRLMDLPSMEGMYVAGSDPKIILSSLRPQGRRSFTCAHEIGHHEFGHGEQFDELVGEKSKARKTDPNEFAADCFAGFFLMPKTAVENGMRKRGFDYSTLTASEAYAMACWLGVGYSSFLSHLHFGLNVIARSTFEALSREQPRDIRQQLIGTPVASELHLVDTHWIGRAVDCQVGDYLLLPKSIQVERSELFSFHDHPNGTLLQANASGIARAFANSDEWAAFVRISPTGYTGRGCYRFEEEVNE